MAREKMNKREAATRSVQRTEDAASFENGASAIGLWDWLIMILAGAIAAVLLFTNLGEIYLWQDEAATAVLGERMLKYGKPLAYDGKNLITMDHFVAEDQQTISLRTGDAPTALRYFIDHHDFKADTSWTGQPWGQFAVAGLSLWLFGHNTVAARAPFSAAAMITVILLYWFIRRLFQNRLMAVIAVCLLLLNTYWILHSRQCRYYALTSLMLLVTLMAFVYWQHGRRFGGLLFVVAGWCWFQVDYGSFWPVIGILLTLSVLRTWPRVTEMATVPLVLAVAVAPWVWYYELFQRLKTSAASWHDKFLSNVFHMNQFLIPMIVLVAGGLLLTFRWHRVPPLQRQLLLACFLILPVSLIWVTSVAPAYYYRYFVQLTPLAVLLMAWLFVEGGTWLLRGRKGPNAPVVVASAVSAIVALCPLPSNLVSWMIQTDATSLHPLGTLIRPELNVLRNEVFGHRIDPNRAAIERIKTRARPEDEILVNFEDIPFMFYTDNPIRGGIPCFRVEDRSSSPKFLVIRQSVPFLHWPVFKREVHRYTWKQIPLTAPDIWFGNNPDPDLQPAWLSSHFEKGMPNMLLGENRGNASAVPHE